MRAGEDVEKCIVDLIDVELCRVREYFGEFVCGETVTAVFRRCRTSSGGLQRLVGMRIAANIEMASDRRTRVQ